MVWMMKPSHPRARSLPGFQLGDTCRATRHRPMARNRFTGESGRLPTGSVDTRAIESALHGSGQVSRGSGFRQSG